MMGDALIEAVPRQDLEKALCQRRTDDHVKLARVHQDPVLEWLVHKRDLVPRANHRDETGENATERE